MQDATHNNIYVYPELERTHPSEHVQVRQALQELLYAATSAADFLPGGLPEGLTLQKAIPERPEVCVNIKTISYRRTINLGNFESATLEATAEVDFDLADDDLVNGYIIELMGFVIDQLELEHDRTINQRSHMSHERV